MSAYNFAAKELDQAFREARDAYKAAEAMYKEVKSVHENAWRAQPGESVYDTNVRKAKCEIRWADAQKDFASVKAKVWPAFVQKRDDIRARLEKAIAKDTAVTPEQIEANTITLLQSGILSVGDLEALYSRFDKENNPTMLKIIGKHCTDLAEKMKDPQENVDRQRLTTISRSARDWRTGALRDFDALCQVADRFGDGYRPDGKTAEFVSAANWEAVTGELIENF